MLSSPPENASGRFSLDAFSPQEKCILGDVFLVDFVSAKIYLGDFP